jgi:exodeoxyribonuclease VII large subunit
VITSPTGAVIRDILHRLQERTFPHIYVFPVAVQGELSARQISYAVNFFNRCTDDTPVKRPDVIIIARGGGSVEDLWSFNEEIVVRAVAGSHIPIISAVGHETDTTLCDYAADKRAPTPTAAAEMAVPVKQDLIYTLSQMNHRLNRAFDKYMSDKKQNLNHLIRIMPKPETLFNMLQQKIDFYAEHLTSALRHIVVQKKSDFQSFASVMRVQLIINLHHHHKNKLMISGAALDKSIFNIINIHKMKVQQNSQYIDILGGRLNKAINDYFKNHHHYINMHHKSLNNLSYKNVLSRGYAVIHGDSGIISSYHQSKTTLPERIEFHDGVLKLK